MIERVEVVRGGGSALFGANAVGGVINVITREPLRNTASLRQSYTSFQQEQGGIHFADAYDLVQRFAGQRRPPCCRDDLRSAFLSWDRGCRWG